MARISRAGIKIEIKTDPGANHFPFRRAPVCTRERASASALVVVVCLTFRARTCPSRSIEAQGPPLSCGSSQRYGRVYRAPSIYDFLIEQPSLTFLEENLTQQRRPRHDVATILLHIAVYIASRNEIFHYYVSYRLPCLPSWKFRESIILPARIIYNADIPRTNESRDIH